MANAAKRHGKVRVLARGNDDSRRELGGKPRDTKATDRLRVFTIVRLFATARPHEEPDDACSCHDTESWSLPVDQSSSK